MNYPSPLLLPLLLPFALATLSPAPANACDSSSYFQDELGQCMNLDALTWLGKAQSATAAVGREIVPFKFDLISLKPGAALAEGTIRLTNISQYSTIKTAWASIIAPNGDVWRPFVEVELKPGEVHVEKVFFDMDGLNLKGKFTSAYNPEISRDLDGVGTLLDQESSSWGNAAPYPVQELGFCLVSADELARLGRSDCPALMWASTQNPCMKFTETGIPTAIFSARKGCGPAPEKPKRGS